MYSSSVAPSLSTDEEPLPEGQLVPLVYIRRNPAQPRRWFDPEALATLAASIKEQGLMQPLRVRPGDEGYYIIIFGERRWRAAQLAGLEKVPVLVSTVSAEAAAFAALAENVVREDLTDEEQAEAYRALMAQGYSQRQIAARLGISPSTISKVLRVSADTVLNDALLMGQITKSEAQELLVAPDEAKPALAAQLGEQRRAGRVPTMSTLRAAIDRARRGGPPTLEPDLTPPSPPPSRVASPSTQSTAMVTQLIPSPPGASPSWDEMVMRARQAATAESIGPPAPTEPLELAEGRRERELQRARAQAAELTRYTEQALYTLGVMVDDPVIGEYLGRAHAQLARVLALRAAP